MKLGDKVKHKNVFIAGEIVQIDEDNVVHVKCEGGTYYDSLDNWEAVEQSTQETDTTNEAVGKEVL